MPTVYTAYIEDGTITNGADFLKLCTRNFGIAFDIRDEPLSVPTPTHFEVNPYYKREYEKAVREYNEIQLRTSEEMKQDIIEAYKRKAESSRKYYKKYVENNKKYLKIKEEILKWIPPTADHEEIKKFALDQIDYCIVSDRDLQRYKRSVDMDNAGLFWTDEEVQDYLEKNKQDFKDSVENAYKRWQKAIKHAEMKNLWMKQFLDSLGTISDETSVSCDAKTEEF